jgi:hypothetical protein
MMSMRALFVFGFVCSLVTCSAVSTGGAAPAPFPKAAAFPQFVRVERCELIKQAKRIVLKGPDGDQARILTQQKHRPPFSLHLKVKTDSRNLRLYYHLGVLIFNWEGNEDELRIHDPATAAQEGVANQGRITPEKYHNVVWTIYPDGMRIHVDGAERFRRRGNYEKLEAAIGIGPAFGSVITLESFRVKQLTGTLPK